MNDLGLVAGTAKRAPGLDPMLAKLLKLMAAAPPKYLLLNMEDLWGETEPQNIPGTWKEYPNWRRKAEVPLEYWAALEPMVALLRDVSARRKESPNAKRAKSAGVGRQKAKLARSRSSDANVGNVSQ